MLGVRSHLVPFPCKTSKPHLFFWGACKVAVTEDNRTKCKQKHCTLCPLLSSLKAPGTKHLDLCVMVTFRFVPETGHGTPSLSNYQFQMSSKTSLYRPYLISHLSSNRDIYTPPDPALFVPKMLTYHRSNPLLNNSLKPVLSIRLLSLLTLRTRWRFLPPGVRYLEIIFGESDMSVRLTLRGF
jgi:hypothetical protein